VKHNIPLAISVVLFAWISHPAWAAAPLIDHGSFISPDNHFSLVYGGFIDREFQYAIKNRQTGTIERFAEPDYSLWGPLYSVQWTGDSRSVLLVYHIADGSVATVLHFNGTTWRELDIAPTPVDSRCPKDEVTENGKTSFEPSYFGTVFDHKVGHSEVWISYGIQTDESRRHSHFYVCNFNYNPETQSLSHVKLHEIDIPTFVHLKMIHDYSESPWPKAS
jgi:hypothetical protein